MHIEFDPKRYTLGGHESTTGTDGKPEIYAYFTYIYPSAIGNDKDVIRAAQETLHKQRATAKAGTIIRAMLWLDHRVVECFENADALPKPT